MKTVVAFDFDGTLTKKDSFIEFIKFSKGSFKFYISTPLIGFLWLLSKLKLVETHKAKAVIFSYFFKNMSLEKFNSYCNNFEVEIDKMLKQDAKSVIKNQLYKHSNVLIVSASIENWIKPWATSNGINTVLATKIAINAKANLTGKFSSQNCVGKEKVNRVLGVFPNRETYKLVVYGDSSGDKALMAIADKVFWQKLK